MTEVGFYHLTRTRLDQALPALLARTLAAGERAVIRAASAERVAALDDALWHVSEPAWLPHGTPRSGDGPLQPIWITQGDDVPNGARFLFLVDGAACAAQADFARIFDLFDGADEAAVAAARLRFAAARSAGHAVSYFRQTARGWEKA